MHQHSVCRGAETFWSELIRTEHEFFRQTQTDPRRFFLAIDPNSQDTDKHGNRSTTNLIFRTRRKQGRETIRDTQREAYRYRFEGMARRIGRQITTNNSFNHWQWCNVKGCQESNCLVSDGLPQPEGHAVDDCMFGPPEQCLPPRNCHYANLVNFFHTLVFVYWLCVHHVKWCG